MLPLALDCGTRISESAEVGKRKLCSANADMI